MNSRMRQPEMELSTVIGCACVEGGGLAFSPTPPHPPHRPFPVFFPAHSGGAEVPGSRAAAGCSAPPGARGLPEVSPRGCPCPVTPAGLRARTQAAFRYIHPTPAAHRSGPPLLLSCPRALTAESRRWLRTHTGNRKAAVFC